MTDVYRKQAEIPDRPLRVGDRVRIVNVRALEGTGEIIEVADPDDEERTSYHVRFDKPHKPKDHYASVTSAWFKLDELELYSDNGERPLETGDWVRVKPDVGGEGTVGRVLRLFREHERREEVATIEVTADGSQRNHETKYLERIDPLTPPRTDYPLFFVTQEPRAPESGWGLFVYAPDAANAAEFYARKRRHDDRKKLFVYPVASALTFTIARTIVLAKEDTP